MSKIFVVLAVLGLGCGLASPVGAQSWEELYPGVKFLSETRPGPVEVRAVEVDLCSPGVSLRATRADESPNPTSEFGRLVDSVVAINGGFYEPDYSPTGLSIGGAQKWSDDIVAHGFVAFGDGRAEISSPRERVSPVPDWIEEAVGGYDTVVVAGEVMERAQSFCKARHPRTVAGLSKDGLTLYLVVVDGRSEESIGMDCAELGALMVEFGAYDALNLDGGGSTTMWISGKGLVNSPSAGFERTVSNHLAVFARGTGPAMACPSSMRRETEKRDTEKAVEEDSESRMGVEPEKLLDDSKDGQAETRRCGSTEGGPFAWTLIILLGIAAIRQRQVAGGQSPRMVE